MYGAIIGDIVGSVYEFDNIKTKDFPLFSDKCFFTDDTVMTAAVAKALMLYGELDTELFRYGLVKTMHEIGNKYINCGYGGKFKVWIREKFDEPYNSWGNGSAMRVSPVIWYAKTLEEAEILAKATADVTHNHPEGIKGAVVTACAGWLAKNGASKEEIAEYISRHYDIGFTLDEIRPLYAFDESCQGTVPQAMVAFLESESFEDAIRNAISIGGDSDTLAAITGAVAEGFYGIDSTIVKYAESYLDEELRETVNNFVRLYIEV
ncbi:MAG: ADP-ribosylglycohydrolase family protein [Oscillospiraceae bacterium]|nr:ADP-ribosylglycohydrolase family protein [Oscillospiraceae bacterium]